MQNERLDFSYNWNNKLDNKCFSTIRIFNKKYSIESIFDVYLKDNFLYTAKVKFEKSFFMDQLNEPMSLLDTGYSKNETLDILRKMYKNRIDLKFHYIILEKQ